MKKQLFIFLFVSVWRITFASCAGHEGRTLTEELFQQQPVYFKHVFTCKTISRIVTKNENGYHAVAISKVVIIKNYIGTTDGDTVEIYACAGNCECAEGVSPEVGKSYLLFAFPYNGHLYTTDLSAALNKTGHDFNPDFANYKADHELAIVEQFADIFNNKKSGHFTFKNATDVLLAEGAFKNGVAVGLWKHYYDNGVIKTEYDLDRHIERKFDQYGSIASQMAKEGQKTITEYYQYFSKDQLKLSSKTIQIDTVQTTFTTEYYVNGQVKLKASYYNKLLKSGAMVIEQQYTGPYLAFYKNGKPMVKGNYEDNKKVGTWYYYYDTGALSNKIIYRHGNEVK